MKMLVIIKHELVLRSIYLHIFFIINKLHAKCNIFLYNITHHSQFLILFFV